LYSVTGVDRISSYRIRAASKMWAFRNYDWEETAYIWRQRWLLFPGFICGFLQDCDLWFIFFVLKLQQTNTYLIPSHIQKVKLNLLVILNFF
jgi:hypothetical protein